MPLSPEQKKQLEIDIETNAKNRWPDKEDDFYEDFIGYAEEIAGLISKHRLDCDSMSSMEAIALLVNYRQTLALRGDPEYSFSLATKVISHLLSPGSTPPYFF